MGGCGKLVSLSHEFKKSEEFHLHRSPTKTQVTDYQIKTDKY
jgi:hypothetical protein